MTVLIRYEYWCDICGEEIRAPDQYCIAPMVPVQNQLWPIPNNCVGHCVGQSHVCHVCLSLGVDAMVKRRREVPRSWKKKTQRSAPELRVDKFNNHQWRKK